MRRTYEKPALVKRESLSKITAGHCGVSRVYDECEN